ncbi:MAG: cohesin domain-containing protein [Clostridia bacterium]
MKSKKIAIAIIMIMFIAFMTKMMEVEAADYTFNLTVNPLETSAKAGDTVTVDLGIADIDQSSDGINAIQGDLAYDDSVFESVEIVATGENWTAKLNQISDSDLKGRFVISNMNSVKNAGVIAQLKIRIKSNVSASKGYVYLKNIFSSYGTTDTPKTNKTITVNIASTSNGNSGSLTDSKNTATQGSNKNENISKSSSLPKTGLNPWLGIGIIIAIIGTVIGYIRYKKIY